MGEKIVVTAKSRMSIATLLCCFFVGCFGGKDEAPAARLKITVAPSSKKTSLLEVLPLKPLSLAGIPDTAAGFHCLGVNVVGSGIPTVKLASSCGKSVALDLSLYSAMIPISGGTIEISVPVGSARTIQVYGITTSGGACPNPDLFIQNRAGNTATSLPYEIGQTTIDVSADVTVSIKSSYRATAPKQAFCSDATIASSGWDSGVWDTASWAD
jgi:hypothetical protein